MADEQEYRKLLRWYPKPWRERNGDAVLGVMLDEAERCGRTGPSWGERWSAFAHGVGMRLDAALAWRLAIIAIVMTACRVLWLFVALWEPVAWIPDLVVWLLMAAAPVLLVIALVAAVRERGFLPDPHALLTACVGALASAAVSLAWVSWNIGFDAADAHRPVPLAGQLFVPLLLCATPVTLIAVSIVTDGLSYLQGRSRPVRLLIGIGVGIVVVPAIWMAPVASFPYMTGLAIFVMMLMGRRHRMPQAPV